MVRFTQIVFLLTVLSGSAVEAQSGDRFWILWEKFQYAGEGCPNGPNCLVRRNFTSRLFPDVELSSIYRLFGLMDGSALAEGRLSEHPDAPRICQHNDAEVVLGFDPEALPKSEKIEALRGLKGVSFNLTKLKAPPGARNDFGPSLQKAFEARFRAAGLKILTPEQAKRTPGQPELAVFFAYTDPDGHCEYTYSVFASLSQTVLLTRDLRIKISAGVWAYSTKPPAGDAHGSEYDSILKIADALVKDYLSVNPKSQ